jgi:chromosome segregation ATPase
MEFEQMVKRLEWLDEERRKDKTTIEVLQKRLASLESTLEAFDKKTKSLEKNTSVASTATARLDQFETIINKQRDDFSKEIEKVDKKYLTREQQIKKRHDEEVQKLKQGIEEAMLATDQSELKQSIRTLTLEDQRLSRGITDLKPGIEKAQEASETAQRAYAVAEENRRTDLKRMSDLQGEIAAVRKRVDEHREKIELTNDSLRYMDGRINDVLKGEVERKKAQEAFIEKQNLAYVDREREWKEWSEKFQNFLTQNVNLDSQIQELDETLRAAKRAQDNYVELNQKLERRINEISEMQRLAEDRLRQEWVSFKADDQKRWTGYTLSQEESQRDIRKDLEKFVERITALDDATQVLQDQLQQTTDTTEQQLQEFMNVAHEWLTAYERIMGHARKAR